MPIVQKGDNFGGIPAETFNLLLGLFSPKLADGLSETTAIKVLFELAREEGTALRPGSGAAGFKEVSEAFDKLKAAVDDAKGAPKSTKDAKVAVLADKLKTISALWSNGPVGFFTIEP